jgi:hydroxypyruvate reductase 1
VRAAAASGPTKAVEATANGLPVKVFNEGGDKRVVVTKDLPGQRWIDVLVKAGCRVEVCTHPQVILDNAKIKQLMGTKVDGVIGQLTGMTPSMIA